jgi:hypothetical protein
MDAFGTALVPPTSQMALCGSNTVAMWRRRYKQQEDQIQALTLEMNALLKETTNKSIIIVDQKAELEHLCSLVKESTAMNDALQQGVATVESEDTEIEVDAAAFSYVVENVTYGLVEPVTTPLGRRRATLMLPPPPTQQPLDTQGM